MGNDGKPRPGYDRWVAFDGHGRLTDPRLNVDGTYEQRAGYMTDILNDEALAFLERPRTKPFSLFFAHKAVHPDAEQAADGTLSVLAGYVAAERHRDLYKGRVFPKTPNMLPPDQVIKAKPAWREAFELKQSARAQAVLASIHAGQQEEIRLRAAMMASVDEGLGRILEVLERSGELDRTFILFFGDNGYFFGEHGLGPERRFAYEAGIRSPFVVRYPPLVRAGTKKRELVICQDIAPTLLELAGATPGKHVQGRSLVPLFRGKPRAWRTSILIEYWAEQAMPWLVGMSYKAVRTDRYKYIRWLNRGRNGELDELYDLDRDPWELKNLAGTRAAAPVRARLQRELRRLAADASGL